MNDADKIKAKIRKILNLDDKVVFLLPDCLDGKRVEMTATDGVRYVAEQVDPNDYKDVLVKELSTLLQNSEREAEKKFEIATRLWLQDMWNDQSEIQALSPEGKTIIWGGKVGEEITKEWEKLKGRFNEANDYLKERGKE